MGPQKTGNCGPNPARWNEQDVQLLLSLHAEHKTCSEIATALGCSDGAVWLKLQQLGRDPAAWKAHRDMEPELVSHVQAMLLEARTPRDIARELELPRDLVSEAIRRHGLRRRNPRYSTAVAEQVRELAAKGATREVILRETGLTAYQLGQLARKHPDLVLPLAKDRWTDDDLQRLRGIAALPGKKRTAAVRAFAAERGCTASAIQKAMRKHGLGTTPYKWTRERIVQALQERHAAGLDVTRAGMEIDPAATALRAAAINEFGNVSKALETAGISGEERQRPCRHANDEAAYRLAMKLHAECMEIAKIAFQVRRSRKTVDQWVRGVGKPREAFAIPATAHELTPDKAWILGAILGDGSLSLRRNVHVTFDVKDLDYANEFARRVRRVYGLVLRVVRKIDGRYRVRITIGAVVRDLARYVPDAKDLGKRAAWTVPEAIRTAFLQGFCDGEGGMNVKKREIAIANNSMPGLRGIQELLAMDGIANRLRLRRTTKGYYVVVSRQENTGRYLALIGSSIQRKLAALRTIVDGGPTRRSA